MRPAKLYVPIIALLAGVLSLTPRAVSAAPGDLDSSFGASGIVVTDMGTEMDGAHSVAIQADGKILVGGIASGSHGFTLARYESDGTLDATFGTNGKTRPSPAGPARSIAIQADGKIVSAGYGSDWPASLDSDFAVDRYHADGSLDTSFGGTGRVLTDIEGDNDHAYSTVLQSDGKILVAGTSKLFGSFGPALVRYNTDGSLDTSFGGTGVVYVWFLGAGQAGSYLGGYDLRLQADGKIVTIGSERVNGISHFALTRHNSDGSLDLSFGGSGIVIGREGVGHALALQSDGKIVAAGEFAPFGGTLDFALERYNSDGTVDTSFGGAGVVTTDVSTANDSLASIALQSNGKIVAVGRSASVASGPSRFAAARYNQDGTLDTTFGGSGIVTTSVIDHVAQAQDVAIQNDGNIVAVGKKLRTATPQERSDSDFAVVRYEGDSKPSCPQQPMTTCTDGWRKASLSVKENIAGKESLVAKLLTGPVLNRSDFGNPLSPGGTAYRVCIYGDEGNLAGELEVDRAGQRCQKNSCWKAAGLSGYVYKDRDASASGVKTMSLKVDKSGRPKISVVAGNSARAGRTSLPTGITGALAGSSSAKIQLFGSNITQCFSATLATVTKNSADQFKAKK